jgi:hypothetical protein
MYKQLKPHTQGAKANRCLNKMKVTFESVNNFLFSLQRIGELKNYKLIHSDGRCGKRIALAQVEESGIIKKIATDYILYNEMNQLLRGYMFKCNNQL